MLGFKPADVLAKLTEKRNAQFVWLARGLDDGTANAVRALDLPGVSLMDEWRRNYPNGSLACHVVGFTGLDAEGRFDGSGLEGIELYADKYLSAADGRRVLLTDAGRRPIWNAPGEYTPPADGNHVQLTLDVVIQGYLEKALASAVAQYKGESGVGVVVDPATGEVLALASCPCYDPNNFQEAAQDVRRNRALTDPFEPGSIFKPFTAVMALASGAVHMGQMFDGHGGVYNCRSGRTLHDAHGYGMLSFQDVVIKNSNIGMAQVGERLGNDVLFGILKSFGFGARTGIELKGEDAGLVNPLKDWTSYTTTSVPMGQEVAVTGLQMTMGFAAIANRGTLLRPRLIRAIYTPDGRMLQDNSAVKVVRQVVDPATAHEFVEQVLAKVPTEGTGKKGRLDGWSSFGKTGTAQVSRQGGHGYEENAFTASYIAGAPVGRPRLVCLVSVRKPDRSIGHYGGTVAAPAVKEVLEESLTYLGVPKDEQGGAAGPSRPGSHDEAE